MDARWPSDKVQIISNLYREELVSRDKKKKTKSLFIINFKLRKVSYGDKTSNKRNKNWRNIISTLLLINLVQ